MPSHLNTVINVNERLKRALLLNYCLVSGERKKKFWNGASLLVHHTRGREQTPPLASPKSRYEGEREIIRSGGGKQLCERGD